jgi:hypothetical protein
LFRIFDTVIGDNRRNTSPVLFVLVLMIVFISFFQGEKDKHNEAAQSVASYTNSSGIQAIMVPAVSSPGTGIFWIKKLNTKFTCPECEPGRELVLNERLSSCYNSYQLEFHSDNPVIGICFPQKVPGQGSDDDFPSIT